MIEARGALLSNNYEKFQTITARNEPTDAQVAYFLEISIDKAFFLHLVSHVHFKSLDSIFELCTELIKKPIINSTKLKALISTSPLSSDTVDLHSLALIQSTLKHSYNSTKNHRTLSKSTSLIHC